MKTMRSIRFSFLITGLLLVAVFWQPFARAADDFLSVAENVTDKDKGTAVDTFKFIAPQPAPRTAVDPLKMVVNYTDKGMGTAIDTRVGAIEVRLYPPEKYKGGSWYKLTVMIPHPMDRMVNKMPRRDPETGKNMGTWLFLEKPGSIQIAVRDDHAFFQLDEFYYEKAKSTSHGYVDKGTGTLTRYVKKEDKAADLKDALVSYAMGTGSYAGGLVWESLSMLEELENKTFDWSLTTKVPYGDEKDADGDFKDDDSAKASQAVFDPDSCKFWDYKTVLWEKLAGGMGRQLNYNFQLVRQPGYYGELELYIRVVVPYKRIAGATYTWVRHMELERRVVLPAVKTGIDVADGFKVALFAKVDLPTSLAFAPEGNTFPAGCYIGTALSGERTKDIIYHRSTDGLVKPFCYLPGEASPVKLAFSPSESSYKKDALYVSANNRDGGRTGDQGGTILQIFSDGSWKDFTPVGLQSKGRPLGLGEPYGMAFGPDSFGSRLFVANSYDHPADIMTVSDSGEVSVFLDDKRINSGFTASDIAFGPESFGGHLYFCDLFNYSIERVDSSGASLGTFVTFPKPKERLFVRSVVFGPEGAFGQDLYAAMGSQVYRVTSDGKYTVFLSGFKGLVTPGALCFSEKQNALYVVDRLAGKIYKVMPVLNERKGVKS